MFLARGHLTPEQLRFYIVCWVVFLIASIIIGWPKRRDRARLDLADRVREALDPAANELTLDTGLDHARIRKVLDDGRVAHVHFFSERVVAPSGARIRGPFARLSVRADDLPRLTVALETRATERDKERGLIREIEVGEGGFDDRFLLVAKRPAPASKALARRAARKAISDAFNRLEMRRLEIHRSEVATTLPAEELRPERCLEMLEVLSTVARELEQVELDVRVLRGERRAIRGDLGRARCAYCHADVTGEEPDLVACESCSTVAHEDCWIELGHCPVLGCKGERPERARAS